MRRRTTRSGARRVGGGALSPTGWARVEQDPNLAFAWDPARNTVIGTGVSDWTDFVAGQTISQITGAQQPTLGPGSCPSGALSLTYNDAALQKLFQTLVAVGNTLKSGAVTASIMFRHNELGSGGLFSTAIAIASGGVPRWYTQAASTGAIASLQSGDTTSNVSPVGNVAANVDSWLIVRSSGGTHYGQVRGVAETSTTPDASYASGIGNVFSIGSVGSLHLNGEVYGMTIHNTGAPDLASLKLGFDEIMGL